MNPVPVVLSQSMARDLFGQEPAVGRTFGYDRYVGMSMFSQTARVIGVAGDTRPGSVREGPKAALYHARTPTYRHATILVRSEDPAGPTMARIRSVVRDVDPALPITTLRPLQDKVAEDLSEDRVLARLSAIIALVAAWLAATGVISVVSQLVIERRRDFGIRAALGASSTDILRHVVGGIVGQAMGGIAVGLALYWGVSGWLEARLFGLGPRDPVIMSLAAAMLLAIALVAAVIPAHRAARIDPVVALRAE